MTADRGDCLLCLLRTNRRVRLTAGTLLFAPLAVLVSACGIASDRIPDRQDPALTVTSVERVFVTRAFGGSLPMVLLRLEFEPAPSSAMFLATGSDGATYRGAAPFGAKICGFPDYLGQAADAGQEGNRRSVGFIVPEGVSLLELRWRAAPDAGERTLPLPDETTVCRS